MKMTQKIFKMLGPGTLYRNMPFVYYLAFLGVIYIALGHNAERNMRKIDALQDDLQEQRWKYMSVHSEVMKEGSRGKIAQSVAQSGLMTPKVAPKEITVAGTAEDNGHE